jgi:hypothetical protein
MENVCVNAQKEVDLLTKYCSSSETTYVFWPYRLMMNKNSPLVTPIVYGLYGRSLHTHRAPSFAPDNGINQACSSVTQFTLSPISCMSGQEFLTMFVRYIRKIAGCNGLSAGSDKKRRGGGFSIVAGRFCVPDASV